MTRKASGRTLSASWICRRFASDMPASVGICAGEGDDGPAVDAAGAVGGGAGCRTAAVGAGVGVGADGVSCADCGMAALGAGGGAGVAVGSAGCGTAAIGAVGGVGSEAGGPAADGAGAVPSAGRFLTDEGEGRGATE